MKSGLIDRLSYRSMKVYGNLSKVIFHALLVLFPRIRRGLPNSSPARKPAPGDRRIPRIIWQTNYTQRVSLQVYVCYLYNRFRAPTFSYRFCDDAECDKFVEQNFPGRVNDAYQSLQIGAARADLWRVLVLLKNGGLYLDIDSNLTTNPERLLESDPLEVFIKMKSNETTNYFMASAPDNPILQEVCQQIVENIEAGTISNVYDLTGPTVLDRSIKKSGANLILYKNACVQGQFINKFGQYIDKPNGVWTIAQVLMPIIKKADRSS